MQFVRCRSVALRRTTAFIPSRPRRWCASSTEDYLRRKQQLLQREESVKQKQQWIASKEALFDAHVQRVARTQSRCFGFGFGRHRYELVLDSYEPMTQQQQQQQEEEKNKNNKKAENVSIDSSLLLPERVEQVSKMEQTIAQRELALRVRMHSEGMSTFDDIETAKSQEQAGIALPFVWMHGHSRVHLRKVPSKPRRHHNVIEATAETEAQVLNDLKSREDICKAMESRIIEAREQVRAKEARFKEREAAFETQAQALMGEWERVQKQEREVIQLEQTLHSSEAEVKEYQRELETLRDEMKQKNAQITQTLMQREQGCNEREVAMKAEKVKIAKE